MKSSRRNFLAAVTGPLFLPGPRRLEGQDRWDPIISENLGDAEPSTLRWLAQLGATHVVFQGTGRVDTDQKGYWTVDDVLRQKKNVVDAGLVLHSMMLPIRSYMQAQLGASRRDQEIENTRKTIRAVAEAGVPKLEWRFWPDFYWDERVGYYTTEGRGGAHYRGFDYSRVQDQPPFPEIGRVSEEEMWGRFRYFASPVIETAEEVGVQLSIHPNDPPVRYMRGVARIFHHTDAFRRLIEEFPSSANGITFCQGTITEMGVDVFQEIKYFGSRGRIQLVHLRGVRGKVPNYVETFIDDGDIDMLTAMKAYREAGFNGPFVSDHTPGVEGDDRGGRIGRSFSHGYIRALVQAVNAMS
jgi:mannonate dehydratase